MIPILTWIKIGAGALIIAGSGWTLYEWHYKPISHMSKKIEERDLTIKSQDQTIKDLGVQITQLIEHNKVTGFEEYFKGLADANTTIDHTDLVF